MFAVAFLRDRFANCTRPDTPNKLPSRCEMPFSHQLHPGLGLFWKCSVQKHWERRALHCQWVMQAYSSAMGAVPSRNSKGAPFLCKSMSALS